MRRITIIIAACAAVLLLTGCRAYSLRAPVKPPQGLLMTTYEAPITTSFDRTPTGDKVGTASTLYFHDFLITGLDFAWGEAGIRQAARRGDISQVHYADYRRLQVLGFFGKYTTEVHGK